MKTLIIGLAWVLGAIALLQFVKIDIPNPPASTPADEIKAPKVVARLLKQSCYDCHSNTTNWPWYSDIAPISFEVRGHVRDGRKWLNFNIWNQYSQEKQQKRLKGIIETIDIKMPLPSYIMAHPEANLKKDERDLIKNWAQSLIKE